jgi:hypothetical protein
MTVDEHQMMRALFQHQTFVIKSLVEVLKSQGLVKEGDMAAYDALFCSNDIARSGLEQQVAFDYQEAAAIYGVTTGLPLVAE